MTYQLSKTPSKNQGALGKFEIDSNTTEDTNDSNTTEESHQYKLKLCLTLRKASPLPENAFATNQIRGDFSACYVLLPQGMVKMMQSTEHVPQWPTCLLANEILVLSSVKRPNERVRVIRRRFLVRRQFREASSHRMSSFRVWHGDK